MTIPFIIKTGSHYYKIMIQSLIKNKVFLLVALSGLVFACSKGEDPVAKDDDPVVEKTFYYGADLSYVNEMEDCGATYKNADGVEEDPFQLFKDAGTNMVRVRLWHSPTWTNYSNFDDVEKTIQRAKDLKMKVLLDFHYSDTWADPTNQEIPAAWLDQINDKEALGILLYNYTYQTLNNLAEDGLLPDIVQVGNEINPMILQHGDLTWPIDWDRNAYLLNKAIGAVRAIAEDRNQTVEVMLHIAEPENAVWWFEQATANGVAGYDWIGLSYYPVWSDYPMSSLSSVLANLIDTYKKRLMVVETAYPYTLDDVDNANNILGADAVVQGYPATQQGQLDYLNALKDIIESSGGEGLIYWEPAWVSTGCSTLWGTGSHWDNATLFDHNNKATLGMQFYNASLNK